MCFHVSVQSDLLLFFYSRTIIPEQKLFLWHLLHATLLTCKCTFCMYKYLSSLHNLSVFYLLCTYTFKYSLGHGTLKRLSQFVSNIKTLKEYKMFSLWSLSLFFSFISWLGGFVWFAPIGGYYLLWCNHSLSYFIIFFIPVIGALL